MNTNISVPTRVYRFTPGQNDFRNCAVQDETNPQAPSYYVLKTDRDVYSSQRTTLLVHCSNGTDQELAKISWNDRKTRAAHNLHLYEPQLSIGGGALPLYDGFFRDCPSLSSHLTTSMSDGMYWIQHQDISTSSFKLLRRKGDHEAHIADLEINQGQNLRRSARLVAKCLPLTAVPCIVAAVVLLCERDILGDRISS